VGCGHDACARRVVVVPAVGLLGVGAAAQADRR